MKNNFEKSDIISLNETEINQFNGGELPSSTWGNSSEWNYKFDWTASFLRGIYDRIAS